MELPVHTGLFRLERRIYVIGEVQLPQPVTLLEAAVFGGALLVLVLLSRLLGVSLPPGGWFLYLFLPWLATRAATRPLADAKRADLWLLAQLRHALLEPRVLARLRPQREPAQVKLNVEVWQPRRPGASRATATPQPAHPLAALAPFRFEVLPATSGYARGRGGRPAQRPWAVWRFLALYSLGLAAVLLALLVAGWLLVALAWGGGR